MRRVWTALVVLAVAQGCVGSNKTYRPYKGEPRPDQEEREDPLVVEDKIKNEVPHSTLANTTYLEQGRKETRALLDTVHRNKDGSPRNAWRSYEKDVTAVLGAGTLKRVAPEPQEKPTGPVKKTEETPAPEGEKKPEGEGDGEKKSEGGSGE